MLEIVLGFQAVKTDNVIHVVPTHSITPPPGGGASQWRGPGSALSEIRADRL